MVSASFTKARDQCASVSDLTSNHVPSDRRVVTRPRPVWWTSIGLGAVALVLVVVVDACTASSKPPLITSLDTVETHSPYGVVATGFKEATEAGVLMLEDGGNAIDAAVTAARLRLRAVLMTAFSFILGVIPLVIASGAGAGSRRSLGTAVFSGMVAASILVPLFVPMFYAVVQGIRERVKGIDKDKAVPEVDAG